MPVRIIQVGLFSVVLLLVSSLEFISSDPALVINPQIQAFNSLQARESLIALETIPTQSTQTPYAGLTIIGVIKEGYTVNDSNAFIVAEKDINKYFNLVSKVHHWKVYTSDGRLNLESSDFGSSRIIGSAKASIVPGVYIFVQVG